MPVEFRVLGPLEIRRDGAPISLRASKQRTFLGALLVSHGRVVSADRLADDLWPDGAPKNARHALEMHATRLRSLLGDDAPLVARAPGYVLELDPQLLDSVRFAQLLDEARDVLHVDPAHAASRADDALSLRRGEPLAEFTFDTFAQEEIARLSELLLDAEELRLDAELALGRDVVAAAQALVAAAPLRERRHAQLMLALYRTGRQADALAAFRAARATLLDELAIEPGDALRDLERAILQQDPSLGSGSPAATPRAASVRRPVSIVAVEPAVSLELDPEEHAARTNAVKTRVAEAAEHFGATLLDPFTLVFAHEDHGSRAREAAGDLEETARVGVASGDALLGSGSVDGPVVEQARLRARNGEAAVDAAPEPVRRSDGPFVGRAEELARLRSARAALVVGPPGIGKSRLVHELARDEPVIVGRCFAFGAELLAPLLEIAEGLGSSTAFDDVPAAEVPLTFRRLVEDAGVTVVFDDVQWASPLVLETIEHVAGRSLRIVCLARDELLDDRPAFMPGADQIRLGPLPPAKAGELARLLGGDDALVERAEGNPLFIEQLLAHAEEAEGALPPTLRSLLLARLDRLPPGERAAIEHAAVLGRDFDAELARGSAPRAALASLVRRGLLETAPSATAFEERYRFAHALIHEAAYEAIPAARRAELHEAVADELVARQASDELIGFHLERAARLRPGRHARQLADDAGRRLGAAGLARLKVADVSGAVSLLERARALLQPGDAYSLELACELAIAYNATGNTDAAEAQLFVAEAADDGRVRRRARLEHTLLETLADGAGVDAMLAAAETAIPVFEGVNDERSLGRAWLILGWGRGGALGQHVQWEEAATQALAYYERLRWSPSTCIGHIAAAVCLGPTPVPAAVARCEGLLRSTTDLAAEAAVSAHLAHLHGMSQDFETAARHLARATEIYTDLGRAPSLLLTCKITEARIARLAGELEHAAAVYLDTCESLLGGRGGFHLATQAAELAEVLLDLGRGDEALRWVETAEAHARAADRAGRIASLNARARQLALARDPDAAFAAEEAVALAAATDGPDLRATAYLALAETLADPESAFAAALAELEQKENAAAAAIVRTRIAAAASA
jgi:DNA-binding SARP family transcriptional activator